MKKLKNIIKSASLVVVAAMATSCEDWLTIYPQTQIVEENFWEDKNDLNGVRFAAYKQMCNSLEKMILWGDLRSDTYLLSGVDEDTNTKLFYSEVREGRMERDSANSYFDWSPFYTTINYCNKVLSHGDEVLAKDKQFTQSEWTQMKAEMTAIRALNYFYLIRSFKDVPYTTKVINNDTQVEYFSASNQLDVLDSIIIDAETVRGFAANRYTNKKDTKGMITNTAIYALLSDMYLWRASLHEGRGLSEDQVVITNLKDVNNYVNRIGEFAAYITPVMDNGTLTINHTVEGDYNMAIKYAELSLQKLAEQTEMNNNNYGASRGRIQNYGLKDCDMYANQFENFQSGSSVSLDAYMAIFSTGNSDESIFELQFSKSDSRKNEVVTSQWGYGKKVHLSVSENAINAIYNDIDKKYDSRVWYSANNNLLSETNTLPGLYNFKYCDAIVSVPDDGKVTNITKFKLAPIGLGDVYHNWIIYRMTDVMLIKAEALARIGQGKEALRIVNAIHRRSYCPDANQGMSTLPNNSVTGDDGTKWYTKTTITSTAGNASSPSVVEKDDDKEIYEIAVLNERQIELLGEGKRWFDLVRYAERHAGGMDGKTQDVREWTEERPIGNGKRGVEKMIGQFLKNTFSTSMCEALKTRLKNRYGLYNLIYYKEIQASKDENGVQHLEQNPVWNKSQYE